MGDNINSEPINVTTKCDECGAQETNPSINYDAKVGQKWRLECPNGCKCKATVVNIKLSNS